MQHEMTREEFQRTREYVENKALELMRHEKKNNAITGVPLENYRVFTIGNRIFYSVQTNTFRFIVNDLLLRAQDLTPENFGTGEAYDVLKAIHLIEPLFFEFDRYVEFLSHERCTYVFEAEKGFVVDRMLRLDLFRLLKTNPNGRHEFIGGLFHALKHFSRQGVNYSIGKGRHELAHPQGLVKEIIEAFFCLEGMFETENEYVVLKSYDGKYNLRFVFYRELQTDIFFLKTVYKEPK